MVRDSIPLNSSYRRKAAYTTGHVAFKSGITSHSPQAHCACLVLAALDLRTERGILGYCAGQSHPAGKGRAFLCIGRLGGDDHAKQQKNSERAMHLNSQNLIETT